jgi:hypothetical protein
MPRLLLKFDGVLCERWNPVEDGPPAEVIPTVWDSVHVSRKYAEALLLLFKMPGGRIFPRGHGNAWPQYRSEWADFLSMLSADDGGEAIALLHQERNHVKIPSSSIEVSRMERSLSWPSDYLHGRDPALVRALNLTALANVRGLSVEDILKRGDRGRHANVRSPTQWHELALAAASRIARGLIADRATVF